MEEASIIIELILIFDMKLRREVALQGPIVERKQLRCRIASATSQKTGLQDLPDRETQGSGKGEYLAHS